MHSWQGLSLNSWFWAPERNIFFISQMPFDYPGIIRGSRHWNQRKKEKTLYQMARDWYLSFPHSQNVWWCPIAEEKAIQVSNSKNHSCGLWRDKRSIPHAQALYDALTSLPCNQCSKALSVSGSFHQLLKPQRPKEAGLKATVVMTPGHLREKMNSCWHK